MYLHACGFYLFDCYTIWIYPIRYVKSISLKLFYSNRIGFGFFDSCVSYTFKFGVIFHAFVLSFIFRRFLVFDIKHLFHFEIHSFSNFFHLSCSVFSPFSSLYFLDVNRPYFWSNMLVFSLALFENHCFSRSNYTRSIIVFHFFSDLVVGYHTSTGKSNAHRIVITEHIDVLKNNFIPSQKFQSIWWPWSVLGFCIGYISNLHKKYSSISYLLFVSNTW